MTGLTLSPLQHCSKSESTVQKRYQFIQHKKGILMKALIVALALMSTTTFATTEECTSTLNSMTALTYTYIDVLKGCKALEAKGETGTRSYEGYRRIARGAEATHQKAVDLCYRVCDDTFFCEGEGLSGACLK